MKGLRQKCDFCRRPLFGKTLTLKPRSAFFCGEADETKYESEISGSVDRRSKVFYAGRRRNSGCICSSLIMGEYNKLEVQNHTPQHCTFLMIRTHS